MKHTKNSLTLKALSSRSKLSHMHRVFLTIMSVTVSISVERILIAINVRIIAAVVATEISRFRSDDANNDSQQQDCVLKEKEQVPSSKCVVNVITSTYKYLDRFYEFPNKFLCTLVYLFRPPSFKFTMLFKNNILRITKNFQLICISTEKWCFFFFNIICSR